MQTQYVSFRGVTYVGSDTWLTIQGEPKCNVIQVPGKGWVALVDNMPLPSHVVWRHMTQDLFDLLCDISE